VSGPRDGWSTTMLAIAGVLIMALSSLAATLVNQRVEGLDKRGLDNQARIRVLEKIVVESRAEQRYNTELLEGLRDQLKEHMARERK